MVLKMNIRLVVFELYGKKIMTDNLCIDYINTIKSLLNNKFRNKNNYLLY